MIGSQSSSGASASQAGLQFAPSELIYLHGEKYAQSAGMLTAKVKLLHQEAKVSAPELGQVMLAATLLACEQSGGIRLRVGAQKALFGLRTVTVLFADPGQPSFRFPDHSLEAEVCAIVSRGPVKVSDLVYALLREDSAEPWQDVAELVKGSLHARGWLESETVTRMKIFKTINYRLPERTAQLAAAQPLDSINHLLNSAPPQRPEVWKLLVSEITSARNSRQKSSDSGDYGSSD